MSGEERRNLIVTRLQECGGPISANKFAEEFSVTRQIVVADVALLRAAGVPIVADNRGYTLRAVDETRVKRLVVKHGKSEVSDEFYAIVDNGGKVLDVIVEHSVYGRLSAELNISSRYDADEFVRKINETKANPLSLLTEGVHIHTIVVESEDAFSRIKQQLWGLGILIEATE
ncbi:MAG: transcription repressor NadR [Clostridia bacterium]|nr:transcription repressor NadR [Clostridia bacterium]